MYTPLCEAIQNNHADVVQVLVNHGCDLNIPDAPHNQPLFMAIAKDSLQITRILIEGQVFFFAHAVHLYFQYNITSESKYILM